MELPDVVAIVVGCVSIALAAVAIGITLLIYDRTKDVLAKISEKAAVIEGTVNETQGKLVDTVTAIAAPKEDTQEDKLIRAFLPLMANNPDFLNRMLEIGQQQQNPDS